MRGHVELQYKASANTSQALTVSNRHLKQGVRKPPHGHDVLIWVPTNAGWFYLSRTNASGRERLRTPQFYLFDIWGHILRLLSLRGIARFQSRDMLSSKSPKYWHRMPIFLPANAGCAPNRPWFGSGLIRFLFRLPKLANDTSSPSEVPSVVFLSWRGAGMDPALKGENSCRPRSTIVISITKPTIVGGFWIALRRSQQGRSRRSCQNKT